MHMQLHYYFTVKVWGEDKCSKLKQYMTSSYIGPNEVIIESMTMSGLNNIIMFSRMLFTTTSQCHTSVFFYERLCIIYARIHNSTMLYNLNASCPGA